MVTGHTGFKGSWLSIWLLEMKARVIGYALDPCTPRGNYVLANLGARMVDVRGDIRDIGKLRTVFEQYKPEVVFHLAAQAVVNISYVIPVETYEINVMGTINVLECIKISSSCEIGIMVTSDKCYENQEKLWGYRETDPMGGYDPYSSSKGAAEIAISSWRRSYFNPNRHSIHGKTVASARAGNTIGGGDWTCGRIVPDCMKSIEENKTIEIRNPKATRPWQHALDSTAGYLLLAQKLAEDPVKYSDGWNFGPELGSFLSVWGIAMRLVACYGKGNLRAVPQTGSQHEALLLSLDSTKARMELNWRPLLGIDDAIELTVDWYKRYKYENVYEVCAAQINEFSSKSQLKVGPINDIGLENQLD